MIKVKCKNSDIEFTVSEISFLKIKDFNWYSSNIGYIRATVDKKRVFLHRYLLKAMPGQIVDHIDGNPLNNCLDNLRLCTHSQNNINKLKKPGKSIYKGVTLCNTEKRRKKWKAAIKHKNKNIYLGRYLTEEEAALAYNKKAIEMWKKFAVINDIVNKCQKRYGK
jgi:hypothetical protein